MKRPASKAIKLDIGVRASRSALMPAQKVTIEGNQYLDYVACGVAYAKLAAEERIPVCRPVMLAAKRFLRMYEAATAAGGDIYWSTEHAIEVCAFIESLTHVKGALAKSKLILEPWQIWCLIAIYGFRWADTGDRVVTIVYWELTRKTGKSLLAAGIALYELGPNAHFGDDVYIIAPKEDQAIKVLEPMRQMVGNDPMMRAHYKIKDTQRRVTFAVTESYARTLTAIGEKQDGHDPKIVIGDEFHALPSSIYTVMLSSQGARPESMFLQIGSAGKNAFGVGWDERLQVIEMLEDESDPRPEYFGAIYTIDEEDFGNWRDENVIRKANPNAGVSTPMRKVVQEVESIFRDPRKRSEFMRTRFNIWGLGENRLIPAQDWSACKDATLRISDFEGQKCWIGADLASRNDHVAKVVLFEDGSDIVVFAKHYVPDHGPWRDDDEVRDIYEEWATEGYLMLTPGSMHSYEELFDDLVKDHAMFDVQAIVFDDQQANSIMAQCEKKGMPVLSMRKNAANFSDPLKEIQARVIGRFKGLRHDGNPVLAWNAQNAIGAANTADLILPKKPSPNSPMKIDGLDAMCQANAARMNPAEEAEQRPVNPMAERGVRIL